MQLIKWFVWFLGIIPSFVQRFLSKFVSFYLMVVPNQSAEITKLNIELAYPELSERQRLEFVRASLVDLGHKFFSLISTWVRPTQNSYQLVKVVSGLDTFQRVSAKKPTLILLPHIGNWELFGVWLTQHRPYTAMFRPTRINHISEMVRKARERGGNVLVPATTIGVRQIWKRLNKAETVIVLPDQAPKEGEGVYVPFFGHRVLTPILPYRLALSTGAEVFIGAAVRVEHHYEIILRHLKKPLLSDQEQWLLVMNAEIEALVRRFPNQYQWEYRRFRNAPDGSLRYP
ncbi:MAG: hypothetical protein CMD66_05115 [Gammaproteobacteria bacterium]|nr:hypothetical protein [Gammaproteobacteria bacterium]